MAYDKVLRPLPMQEVPGISVSQFRENLIQKAANLFDEALALKAVEPEMRLRNLLRASPLLDEWLNDVHDWQILKERLELRQLQEHA